MKNEEVRVSIDFLEEYAYQVFRGMGLPEEDARICTDVLITADRRGIDTHGIARLKTIYYDRVVHHRTQSPITRIDTIRDRGATALLDGNNGMGMVIAYHAMQLAIRKAEQYGMGMVAVRNSNHYGIAGYYALMACEHDMIGLTGTNARPSVAPTHGVENMLGTNPLVFGIPTDEPFHFTNDYATSISQRGKIEQYARENKPLPEGWVIDRQGRFLTDPHHVLDALLAGTASLLPLGGAGEELGGHKGYGFCTVVELLSAALSQGPALKDLSGLKDGKRVPYRLGHFFAAINVAFFADPEDFKKRAGDILRRLRASQLMPGAERIYTCGEKEYLAWQERRKSGVPILPKTQKEMIQMRDELGLALKLPFE